LKVGNLFCFCGYNSFKLGVFSMRVFKLFISFLFIFSVMTTMAFAQNGDKLPKLNIKEFKLKNGLRVIMHVDKSTPIVAVNVWYHVGSKNEVVGRTGFAHLFEHMMFQGSKHYDKDFFGPLQEAGANINGSTNTDRTNYFEVVPSNFLELALWLESDRMGYLLDAMTQQKLDNQRDVVKNERRQRVDNQPYGQVFEKLSELAYPKGHPYSWTTIGSMEDLSAASLDDVKSFFRQYYVPNNASLVIAGDFDPKQAKKWIEKYFGEIPTGAAITRPNPTQPKFEKEVRFTMEDAVQLPRLYINWHTVPQGSADEPALDMLGRILSFGRGSRLSSNLVFGKQLSLDAGAFHSTREIAGGFQITSTARPMKSLEEIEKEILAEIEKIKKEPPTAEEMNRALSGIETQNIFGLQTVLGKADAINANVIFSGKPDTFQEDLDKYRKVTAADVQRVANTYLTANKLVLTVTPRPKGKDAPKMSEAATTAANKPAPKDEEKDIDREKLGGRYVIPKPGPNPTFALPKIEKNKLSNGLEVWSVKQTELPIVSMNLVIKTGQTADPMGMNGLTSFTANQLNKGTKTRNAVEIANLGQIIGGVGAGADWDSTTVGMSALTKNFDKALDLFSDVLLNPTFPADELEQARRSSLVQLLQRKDSPTALSSIAYNKVLYGENHPYGRTTDEKSLKAIKREDLVKFYETYYRPNNAVLVVTGDVDTKTLLPKLEKALSSWKSAEVPASNAPVAENNFRPGIYIVDKPNAAQSLIQIGQIGVARDNADFIPLQVMNSMLGGQFTSRINMNLREDKGYTYGARTGFSFRKGAGPFSASAEVQTFSTKESVVEFLKELNGIRGAIPVTQKELDYNKQSLIRSFPSRFETVGAVGGGLANLIPYGLDESYFNSYIQKVNSVTLEDVNRVANKYLQPDKMAIVIVGDKKSIEAKLKEMNGLAITYLDADGNPVVGQ
jgi:zinc protease